MHEQNRPPTGVDFRVPEKEPFPIKVYVAFLHRALRGPTIRVCCSTLVRSLDFNKSSGFSCSDKSMSRICEVQSGQKLGCLLSIVDHDMKTFQLGGSKCFRSIMRIRSPQTLLSLGLYIVAESDISLHI